MSYNTKNYTEQGGEVTHFGGKVIFEDGSQVEGLPSPTIPDASTTTKGLVKQGAAVSDAAGEAPTAAEFNALLASLRTAGVLATGT
ncbi:MAG: Head fiber protein [Spirochaetales bacterium]|nr:Head fiber protein [Spirochaetales bacterium]